MGVSLCKVHLTNRTSILLNKSCDLGNISKLDLNIHYTTKSDSSSIYTTRIMRYSIQNNCDSDLNIHLGPQINTRDVNTLNTKTIGIFIGNCKCSSSPRSALLLKLFLFLGVVSATVGLTFYTITYTTTTTGMIFYEAFIILTDRREFYYIKHHHQ